MENNFDRIVIDEAICNGKPIIRGYRITVKTILEYLAAGETHENILEAYPFLEEDDITACIQFAARAMDSEHHSLISAA
ncbi:DUF433 domain-containing protein [Dyadobacter frigoris]|uniref:DUF433 domain-containing protein n=1 Tax=Dyadobacter frigoris TaxID=2576211 RepID=A0A4U6DD14_9BACT|nr:DUF433 domain-containing protein [Dyadobacter frigoris]TKT94188.1 DUF433 domain-containing protein [Dyadobacter frigoris]GLU50623.1 hypothetical protein Dfri01_00840 [Dyadobacter frigoris]